MSEPKCPTCGAPATRHPTVEGSQTGIDSAPELRWRFDAGAGSGAPSEPSDAAIGAAFEYLESENGCDLPEVVGRECMREILSAAYAVDGLRGAPADAARGVASRAGDAPPDDWTEWDNILNREHYFSTNDPVRVFVEKLLAERASRVSVGDATLRETLVADLVAKLEPLLDNAEGYDKSTVRAAFLMDCTSRRADLLRCEEAARIAWKALRGAASPVPKEKL